MGAKMRFIIGGHTIELTRLGSSIDDLFIALHSAHFANQTLDLAKFEKAALEFFDKNIDKYTSHDSYFNNFTVIWNSYLSARNFNQAEMIWDMALTPAFIWESKNPSKRIHKGTEYGQWACDRYGYYRQPISVLNCLWRRHLNGQRDQESFDKCHGN